MELPRFKPGDRVNYDHRDGRRENGVVKRCENQLCTYVVFRCGGDWDNYGNYTAEACQDWLLSHGWVTEVENMTVGKAWKTDKME